jgi:Carboxypeptidase regulatory-like domain
MRICNIRLALLLVALALVVMPAFGQVTSGNITGSVYDQTGATVPNATIVVRNQETDQESSTTSTSAGDYRFENLTVGKYTLTATAAGFSKAEVKDVEVQLNVTVTTNINLAVGQSTTSVQVSEAAVAVDTTTAQIQTTFDSKQISDLPNTATGSGVLNLSLLQAGVGTSGSVGAGSGPSIGGQRPRNNNFTIEGIDNNSGTVTGPMVSIPNDAVAEFTLMANQYSPDFGHSSGGQFNQIVKSGTNQFHGTLYEYFQNRNLDAADNFNAISGTALHPRFDNNRFGGTVGGPIKKNKLFFFLNYEYNPVGSAGSAGLLYAPTAAGYATIAADPQVNQTNLAIFQKYAGTAPTAVNPSVTPYPLLGNLADGPEYKQSTIVGTPIQIGQISVQAPNYSNFESGVAAIDYNISDKDALRGRFVMNRDGFIDTAATFPVFYQTIPDNFYLFALSEYHNFTPTLINEFRAGYNRNSTQTAVGNQTFPGLDAFPNLVFNELNGLQIGPDPNAPQGGYQNTYQATDNVTWTKGSHSFKFGFDGIRNISPQTFTQRSRGDYEYNYFSDYLLDFTPDYLAQRSQGFPIYWGNRWLFGWYGNDTWKLRPNLTVNLGLRYEYDTVPAAEEEQSLNSLASVPGLIEFNSPRPQTDNFMPRIGIAYSPGTSGKTSIRAGFGINYDVLFDNLGLLSLPPELSTTVDVTGCASAACSLNGQANGGNFLATGGIPGSVPSSAYTPAEARAATAGFVPDVQRRPKSYQWNIGIQHEFAGNYVFESRYLGTRGLDLPVQDQLNIVPIVNGSNALPLYWSMPSVATLNSLPNTLGNLDNIANSAAGGIVPAYFNAGFNSSVITSYQPYGSSIYHGWANQLTRRFSNGLQFIGAYTWSHAIDNSTAEVFSTYATPRRPQNSQDVDADRSSSALDHRQRFSMEVMYDVPFFKHSNWLARNVLGNWEIAPIYTYQVGQPYTVQAGDDANLNFDSAPDRATVNPSGGTPGVGTGTTALCVGPTAPVCPTPSPTGLTAQQVANLTVGYVVNNPKAQYAATPTGVIATAGRNTSNFPPINDLDVTAAKRFNFNERASIEFSARFFNILNHPQYVNGLVSDVAPTGTAANASTHDFYIPTSQYFGDPSEYFSSNPRNIVLALKLIF